MVEEIQLVLLPPIDATQLIRFTGRTGDLLQSRMLQVVGSWQEGAVITIGLDEAVTPADVIGKLENMPEVKEIAEEPLSPELSQALLQKAADIPRLRNKSQKTIFITLGKVRV